MGQTVAIMNTKGGVGKSTIVLALAETLSLEHGKNVLVIDSDAQASVSHMLMTAKTLTDLQQQGLTLVERNYRYRFGEIDLITAENDTLVFVEVRMRASNAFGGAAASITADKQTKLLIAARHYLSGLRCEPACRFDAVLITGTQRYAIEWIRNAFNE